MLRIPHRTLVLQTAAALFAVGAVACTSQEAVPPATGGTRPVTATSVDSASTTDATSPTTAPATTDPALTTVAGADTTDAPTTTPEPPTGRPTVTLTEYFGGGDPDGWLPLGAWTGNAWEPAIGDDGTVRATEIGQNVDVGVYELDVARIDGTTGAPAQSCADGRIGPVISPNARAPEEPGFGYRSIAFAADWATQPRKIATIEASIDAYLDNGRAAFADTGVDTSGGEIEQLVVADLDGDGDTEALIAFGGATYHAMVLIDADSGAGITVARSFAAPAAPAATTTAPPPDPADYRVLAVADLNGDGLMEVVVHSWSGQSSTTTIYEYDGDAINSVLAASC